MFAAKKHFNKISAGVFVLLLVLVVIISLTDANVSASLIREGGVVETLSAIGYFVCLLFFMLFCRHVKGYWSFAYLLLCMGLRELDLHHSFSKWSITSIPFWFDAEISIYLKLVIAGNLSLLIFSAVIVVKNYYKEFVSGLKLKEPTSVGVCCGLIVGMLSQAVDDLYKEIEKLKIGPSFNDAMWVLEECMEFGIPIFFFIAILAVKSGFSNNAGILEG